jgi:hypothetical protein
MKYVMLEDSEGRKIPIIFPDALVHRDVAETFKLIITRTTKGRIKGLKFVSAGFVSVGTDVASFGESESMNLKSKETDAAYIVAGDAGAYMPEIMVSGLLARIKARTPK